MIVEEGKKKERVDRDRRLLPEVANFLALKISLMEKKQVSI